MPVLCHDYLKNIISVSEAPCISIYQPTSRTHPENLEDPIRFKNLAKKIEASLDQHYSVREMRTLMPRLNKLQADYDFWAHALDGLGVLASPTRFDVFKIPRNVPELAIVAENFHIKPLLRYIQSSDRFQVLAIAEDRMALYEGNRYKLDPMPMPQVSGQIRTPASSDPRAEVVVGQGIEGYFRMVDQAVTQDVSELSRVPLILAGLSENLTPFRAVTKNPYILTEAISGVDAFALDLEQLRVRAWAVVEPFFLARLARLSDEFGLAVSRQLGTADLSDAARAAVAARVSTLLIDADQVQPGHIDLHTGEIKADKLCDPKVDDKLDDLAEIVLRTGGEVILVPAERMPTSTGLAAIYRF